MALPIAETWSGSFLMKPMVNGRYKLEVEVGFDEMQQT